MIELRALGVLARREVEQSFVALAVVGILRVVEPCARDRADLVEQCVDVDDETLPVSAASAA
jgi:hypothetical protein